MPAFEPVRYAALTDVGVKRSHNQDACSAQPAADEAGWRAHGHVFVVADGMGGHAVGEKASAKAARDIPFIYLKHAPDGVLASIRRAFVEANAGIYSIGQENPEFRGMGTTGTALVLRPEGAWVGHVGDSRAYRVRGGKAEQLTFDHSWVWEVAKRQGVDPDELGDFKKNVIIRSLGPDPEVEVDVEGPHPVEPGDAFLMCSDGLSNQVPGDEIGAAVAAMAPDEAAKFLVDLANLRGGPDNITVVIVKVPGGAAPGSAAAPATPARKALTAWNRRVPWPFTVLGGGSILALLSFVLMFAEVPGAKALFVVAALAMVAGLVGLGIYLKGRDPQKEADDEEASGPRVLNIHKTYNCEITPPLIDRMAKLEDTLVETMKAQEIPADWPAHAKLSKAADAEAARAATPAAFRARCLSLGLLAQSFNKARHKEEGFKPKW